MAGTFMLHLNCEEVRASSVDILLGFSKTKTQNVIFLSANLCTAQCFLLLKDQGGIFTLSGAQGSLIPLLIFHYIFGKWTPCGLEELMCSLKCPEYLQGMT